MKQFVYLQYLRAAAALMVVFQHSQFVHHPQWGGIFGGLGVHLFFAISGFVIFATTRCKFSLGEFAIKRCIRIVPLYWTLTLALAALVLAAPGLFKGTVLDPNHLVRSLLFIPTYSPGRANEITPLLPPGWTLNYEMFFYVIFGVLLFALRSQTALLLVLGSLFLALVLCGPGGSNSPAVTTYTSPLILYFLAGIAAAYLVLRAPRFVPPPIVNMFLMTVGWSILIYVGFVSRAGGPIVLAAVFTIVYSSAALDCADVGRRLSILALMGDASYSIYLVQIFTIGAIKQLTIHTVGVSDSTGQAVVFIATCMLATAAVGVVLYLLFEAPIIEQLKRSMLRRTGPATVGLASATAPVPLSRFKGF